ncbi:50S ribosomal protein L18 [Malacoplasma iowae]|uniref:Large ribosomal subunit protein uL18 n=2 Tax=Malacoplasma iowae TaxID=2116 RepID=A0A084U338_MALIO|nr:50S ribosomal protein L18 [Malacoplasma iowae]VEU62074.1 50S ribosomal protein L18 [Mycoplasmopsis fermentans]EGZ31611.1 50S ribosomal protein L18 [Malacoplasma iowae 695]KFB07374.1 ribosomal protein L18 [Malacoplasma iowae DK-CPA]QHG89981.1 50S ribosomal protein L18 [Malacoplasma iowae 695]WPL36293.1 50S ribosomal protein L18 [Malacoplasma iowae]
MKDINVNRKLNRELRHKKVLRKFHKIDNGLPRLIVTKTNAHIFAQLIDDNKHITIASSSSLQLKLKNGNIENSKKVGEDIAKKAIAKKVKKIHFDCGGSKYHGRISALADAARNAGLKF